MYQKCPRVQESNTKFNSNLFECFEELGSKLEIGEVIKKQWKLYDESLCFSGPS